MSDLTAGERWAQARDARALLSLLVQSGEGWERALVRATCACAREVLRFAPAGEGRPGAALDEAEAWSRGESAASVPGALARAMDGAYDAWVAVRAADRHRPRAERGAARAASRATAAALRAVEAARAFHDAWHAWKPKEWDERMSWGIETATLAVTEAAEALATVACPAARHGSPEHAAALADALAALADVVRGAMPCPASGG